MSIFNVGTNLDQTGSKYLMEINLDIKIEIAIFEIWNVSHFNKSWEFLILGPICAEQVANIS